MKQDRSRQLGMSFAGATLLVCLALGAVGVAPAEAGARKCAPVVKKIYSEPDFYKAKVFIVRGRVGCAEARKVIWRALQPGGFWGNIRGWECVPKGSGEHVEKCFRDERREVIKSGKPRLCRQCTRNRN